MLQRARNYLDSARCASVTISANEATAISKVAAQPAMRG